jgi:hypothetical protein
MTGRISDHREDITVRQRLVAVAVNAVMSKSAGSICYTAPDVGDVHCAMDLVELAIIRLVERGRVARPTAAGLDFVKEIIGGTIGDRPGTGGGDGVSGARGTSGGEYCVVIADATPFGRPCDGSASTPLRCPMSCSRCTADPIPGVFSGYSLVIRGMVAPVEAVVVAL